MDVNLSAIWSVKCYGVFFSEMLHSCLFQFISSNCMLCKFLQSFRTWIVIICYFTSSFVLDEMDYRLLTLKHWHNLELQYTAHFPINSCSHHRRHNTFWMEWDFWNDNWSTFLLTYSLFDDILLLEERTLYFAWQCCCLC